MAVGRTKKKRYNEIQERDSPATKWENVSVVGGLGGKRLVIRGPRG